MSTLTTRVGSFRITRSAKGDLAPSVRIWNGKSLYRLMSNLEYAFLAASYDTPVISRFTRSTAAHGTWPAIAYGAKPYRFWSPCTCDPYLGDHNLV